MSTNHELILKFSHGMDQLPIHLPNVCMACKWPAGLPTYISTMPQEVNGVPKRYVEVVQTMEVS
jgi:hypothetical protein